MYQCQVHLHMLTCCSRFWLHLCRCGVRTQETDVQGQLPDRQKVSQVTGIRRC